MKKTIINRKSGKKRSFNSSRITNRSILKSGKNTRIIKGSRGIRNKSTSSTIQYVLPLGNGWVVKTNKAAKFFLITDSKKEAVDVARKLAMTKKSELIVHGKDGKIQVRESYVAKAS